MDSAFKFITMKKTFNFGLCLAGAVSAGAYTAGVLDYLFEVLDRWEKARSAGFKVPKHNVKLNVINGTSAGGMTAIIAARALSDSLQPVTKDKRTDEAYKAKNLLYNTWVNLDRKNGKEFDFNQLLDTSDLKADANSLVNADFIDDIAKGAVTKSDQHLNKSYLNANLELLVTLTNLIGLPYYYRFKGAVQNYDRFITSNHVDYYHFMLQNGSDTKKGRMPLDFKTGAFMEEAREAAIATGAFPVGLKARELKREKAFINDNEIINYSHPDLLPDSIRTINVDGGVVNNEPFEITEKILDNYDQNNAKKSSEFSKFQVLVDPFPTTAIIREADESVYSPDLMNIINRLLSAMRSQLLFKPEHVESIFDEDNYSRYIIAPVNERPIPTEGETAIACGALGGFSGFLDRRFREHDFYLGRRNCQRFLRNHLAVPVDAKNEIIEFGYDSSGLKDEFSFEEEGVHYLPVIPDLDSGGHRNNEIEDLYHEWPQLTEKEIFKYENGIKKRTGILLDKIIKPNTRGLKLIKWIAIKWSKGSIANDIARAMVKKLKAHLLISDGI